MKQGDVYWHTFRSPDKRRPVLILTRSSMIPYLTGITVAPITTTIRNIPSEVFLSVADGMDTGCAVNLDNIQTIQKSQLGAYITSLSDDLMRDVRAAIEFVFDFNAMS